MDAGMRDEETRCATVLEGDGDGEGSCGPDAAYA
jgi:hypothetical protein